MTEKKKYRIKGHGGYALREEWIIKGLEALSRNQKLFMDNAGAEELGTDYYRAKAIRYWMKQGGLTVESRYGVYLSRLGELMLQKDPYLEDMFSLWLLHCNIASSLEGASVWHLFFNVFDDEEFTWDSLEQKLVQIVGELPGMGKCSHRSVAGDCNVLLKMYTGKRERGQSPEKASDGPFTVLDLVKKQREDYRKQQPDLYNLPEEVVWYLLPDTSDSFSAESLMIEKNGPGKLLNLKYNGLIELLERLSDKGILKLNRTSGRDMVYLQTLKTKEEIIEKYYG